MTRKPRIALVVDTIGWAFWNIAHQLRTHLSDSFDFDIIAARELDDDIVRILLLAQEADLVHFFWREHYFLFDTTYTRSRVQSLGLSYEEFCRRFINGRVFSTSVQDHLFLEPHLAAERRPIFSRRVAGYYVGSAKLRAAYEALEGYPAPAATLPDGVDTTRFQAQNVSRFDHLASRPLVVGWCGNSRWVDAAIDFKGVNTLLRPALAQLKREGIAVEERFADRNDRMIPHSEMPAYYSQIDVYVCASLCEGTPNPVLEAMAAGVPIVSTDVGIVPDALGPRQRPFIVEREIESIKRALTAIKSEKGLARALSEENRQQIAAWDWSHRAAAFRPYFESLLAAAGR